MRYTGTGLFPAPRISPNDPRRPPQPLACRYLSGSRALLEDVAFPRRPGGFGLVSPQRGVSTVSSPSQREAKGSSGGRRIRRVHPADTLPGVLLDRDGTIIVDHGHVGSVERVEFIAGAVEAIARLNGAGVPVAVVTNQAGVARGLYDIGDVEEVHRFIAGRLAEQGAHVDRFFYCPYHPQGTVAEFARQSDDRKPEPGMARAAAQALNLDLASSWVVGDRPEDIGLAEAVGASAIYVGPDTCTHPGVWSFPDLFSATDFILERMAV
jgi:histidinol-phosphate phosphatase family protein